jgi:hypothetical protein
MFLNQTLEVKEKSGQSSISNLYPMSNDLFQPASRHKVRQEVVIGGQWAYRYPYIRGYYRAARKLVKFALDDQSQDTLFYPICFNYRHYTELHLKELIHSLERFYLNMEDFGQPEGKVEEMKSDELDHTHSLHRLLNLFEERIEAVSDEPLDFTIRSMILELHRIDTSGQSFRYARTTDGEPSIPERKHIDLSRLAEGMEEVSTELMVIDSWLDEQESELEEIIERHLSEDADLP